MNSLKLNKIMLKFDPVNRIKDDGTGLIFSPVLALFSIGDGAKVEVYIYFNFRPVNHIK